MTVLLRYFPRHLADHLITRGIVMFLIGAVMLLPFLLVPDGETAMSGAELVRQSLSGITPFLTLVATYGIVEQDVRHGYYRFLFSKPVSPVGYYGASFLASAISFLVIVSLMIGLIAIVREPVWPGGLGIADLTLMFLLLGALVFAFSRFTRADWVLGIVLLLIGSAARRRWPPDESALGAVLNVLLPPDTPRTFFPGGRPDWSDIGWTLGYAAVALAAGLLAVRFMPFGEHR